MRGVLVAVAGFVMLVTVPVFAAPELKGFTVAPAFEQVRIKADQPRAEYRLKIRNHNALDQNFRLSLVDFGALDEGGGVAFLGTPASELEHRYGLASWMTLEKEAVFVRAGTEVEVVVAIENRSSLAPGGHYGAVLATAVTDTGQIGLEGKVGVKQVLSSLVLVSKEGGAEVGLRLSAQTPDHRGWRLPTKVEQRFQNIGNIHVVPRGVTEVRDMTGRVVMRGALNEQSGVILPESFRRYTTPLLTVGKAWLPGRYQLVTTYRYDGTEQTKTGVVSFWYVGTLVVWLVMLGVVLAIGALAVWLFWWRPRHGRR